jgi:hypothetical protein
MENQTSFDLNLAIQRWREELGQSPAFRSENLDELESHLRDSTTTLQTRGLSAEEAFVVAKKRVGGGASLEAEFGKVNGTAVWLDRLFWMLIGLQVWGFVSGVIGLITRNALYFGLNSAGYDFKSHGHAFPVTLFTLVHLAGFAGSLALCWWLFCRKGQRFDRWLGRLLHRRATLALTFGALCPLSLSITPISWATQYLLVTSLGREKISGIYFSQSISGAIILLITTAALTWLTLFLARKRLRLNKA